jgi:hypothetical protein
MSGLGKESPMLIERELGLPPLQLLWREFAGDLRRRFSASLSFLGLCAFIAAVSVHDAYLLVHNRQTIGALEQNPLGRWLIECGGGEVWLFVLVKLTTTAAVCQFLLSRYRTRPLQSRWIAAGVAGFQFGLLLYLSGA